jgi:predicted acylesterase/phospholipase RssA
LANPLEFFDPRNFFANPVASFTRLADDSLYLFWDFFNRFMYVVNPPDEEGLTERLLYTIAIDNFITREPFNRLVREVVKFDAIRRNRRELRVAATNWETGEVDIFSNFDFTDKLGPRIIMASSALPGFFTPETVGAQAYVDGAVLLNTPLKPAIRAGADCLHVIYLDPDVSSIPLHYLGNLLSTLYRTQVINWASTVNESIREAEGINDALQILNAVGELSKLSPADHPSLSPPGRAGRAAQSAQLSSFANRVSHRARFSRRSQSRLRCKQMRSAGCRRSEVGDCVGGWGSENDFDG